MQMLDPVGIDRWPFDLFLKYGMRDALTCSSAVDGWSPIGPPGCSATS